MKMKDIKRLALAEALLALQRLCLSLGEEGPSKEWCYHCGTCWRSEHAAMYDAAYLTLHREYPNNPHLSVITARVLKKVHGQLELHTY